MDFGSTILIEAKLRKSNLVCTSFVWFANFTSATSDRYPTFSTVWIVMFP